MQLDYPNVVRNRQKSTAAELNNNFLAILAIVNKAAEAHGNIQGDNISVNALLTAGTITVTTKVITATIDCNGALVIKLPSNDGSHSVLFKDHNGATRLEVTSDSTAAVEVK